MKGKVAIITGSTSGIGESIARKLSSEGVNVVITGQNKLKGNEIVTDLMSIGNNSIFVEGDLRRIDTPARLVQAAVNQWGKVDIIVNNAALINNQKFEESTHEEWDSLFAVNVKAPFFLVQETLPWLKLNGGVIVNISSINSIRNAPNNFIYDSLKAALNHLTRAFSLDLREYGIRCNALMPGGIATPLLNDWWRMKVNEPQEADRLAEMDKDSSKIGKPEHIANIVKFLCSDESSWINGTVIPADYGYHIG